MVGTHTLNSFSEMSPCYPTVPNLPMHQSIQKFLNIYLEIFKTGFLKIEAFLLLLCMKAQEAAVQVLNTIYVFFLFLRS